MTPGGNPMSAPAPPARSRPARPADYDAIAAVVDDWWGRPVLGALPRLFLDHFHATSRVVDGAAGPEAFLVGFLSPSEPDWAYIQFVGVSPAARGRGLARQLYEEFFALARAGGRRRVGAVTGPVNARSVAFHRAMGFAVTGPVAGYDGPGHDKIVFEREL
jgi:ribosomal protein S18 acetylase RimI-like enzyme